MKNQRRQRIMEHLGHVDTLSVEQAMELLGASAPTIRRDFNELAATGEVRRFYGGIAKNRAIADPALPFSLREQWFAAVKRNLAAMVAAELPDHGVLFIDGGTTTAHLGMFLNSENLRILTNSLALVEVFNRRFPRGGGPEIIMAGGRVNHKSAILLGPEAEKTIARYHADIAIISGTAMDENFLYDNRDDAAEVQRTMIANAARLLVVADAGKLGTTAMCRVEPVEKIFRLYTSFNPDKHYVVAALRNKGIPVSVLPENASV